MTGKTRSSLLSLAIIAVLVFGAVSPTIAHADDNKPPTPPPTQSSSACTANDKCSASEGVATKASDDAEAAAKATSPADKAPADSDSTSSQGNTSAASTPAPATAPANSNPNGLPATAGTEETTSGNATKIPQATETVVSSSNPTTVPQATETTAPSSGATTTAPQATETTVPAAASATPAPVLTQVPANTTVTVLDAQGQSQPLATQDTAAAIATTSDPIWCPAGQTPTPGANGCTATFSSFNALLTFLSGNATYQGAGTIYVQQGTYNGGESSIDFNSPTYNLSNIKNSDLTITGGWNTSTNAVDPTTTSNFTIPILIGTGANPWGGSLFINNIAINKTTGSGLTLYSQGSIALDNVTVTNSANGSGAELNATGDVSINHSTFSRNKVAGAIIRANNNVAIANSSFSNPVGGRVQNTGMDITANGSVALLNVLANEDRLAGANINAGGRVSIKDSFFSGTKSIKGSGASQTFFGYGLQVVTPDAIDLAGVTASDNFLWGASLKAGGDVTIADSIFNANTTASPGFIDDTGLLVTSGGSVALNNVQANDNRMIGAKIDASGDVAINNSSFSNNNGVILSSAGTPTFYGYGLQVVTPGNIALNLVTASNNTLFGAHLESGMDTTVANSAFSNQTSGSATNQTGRGLEIVTTGNVFLSNVTMDHNQTFGANIQAGGNIFLDAVTATNNGSDGVDAQGNCTTVFLSNGTYSNNGGYGLSILNAALNQTGSPVFAGNGTGDIFQNPGTCVFPAQGTTGGTGNGNSTGPAPVTSNPPQTTSHQAASLRQVPNLVGGKDGSALVPSQDSKHVITLNSFLATGGNNHLSIFVGSYAYIYLNYELHIIAFSPASNSVAMAGS